MKNVIISFITKNNPNDVSENALESVSSACIRWNCDRIIITKPLQPHGFHDMFTKIFLPNIVKNYDQCLYLDTDVIINESAPNPFNVFSDQNKIYVVKDMQQQFLTDEEKTSFKHTTLAMPWFNICKHALKISLDPAVYINGFFNAGVILFSPKIHHKIFKKIQNSLPDIPSEYRQIHQVEQALINYICMSCLNEKLTYIPQLWNYIDPPLDSPTMNGYIYHFTGWKYEIYKEKIYTYTKWKA